MEQKAKDLIGGALKAKDGQIGKVKDVLFDDEKWGIRYLVADTGGWLKSHKVLISPKQLERPVDRFLSGQQIPVDLTKTQIEESPLLEEHEPVSRRYEREFALFHQHNPYWSGGEIWGTSGYPYQEDTPSEEEMERHLETVSDINKCHIRSIGEVTGYSVFSSDDQEVGYLDDVVIDLDDWRVKGIVVSSRKWLPGRTMIVGVGLIDQMEWLDSRAKLKLPRKQIDRLPED